MYDDQRPDKGLKRKWRKKRDLIFFFLIKSPCLDKKNSLDDKNLCEDNVREIVVYQWGRRSKINI